MRDRKSEWEERLAKVCLNTRLACGTSWLENQLGIKLQPMSVRDKKAKKDTLGSQRHTHTRICMLARACICLNFNMLSFSICNICCSSWPCNILLQIFLLELSQRGEDEKRTQSEMGKKTQINKLPKLFCHTCGCWAEGRRLAISVSFTHSVCVCQQLGPFFLSSLDCLLCEWLDMFCASMCGLNLFPDFPTLLLHYTTHTHAGEHIVYEWTAA